MTTPTKKDPIDPKRLRSFAKFFKSYMSVSSLVVASLPIPITSLKLLPVFAEQVGLLSVYTSMFCFLMLGFIFYSRHSLAKLLFPMFSDRQFPDNRIRRSLAILWRWVGQTTVGYLPAIFIVASMVCMFLYHYNLGNTLSAIKSSLMLESSSKAYAWRYFMLPPTSVSPNKLTTDFILKNFQISASPYNINLMQYYFGIFMFAEMAFIMMAIKEYMQDVLGLTEIDLVEFQNRPL